MRLWDPMVPKTVKSFGPRKSHIRRPDSQLGHCHEQWSRNQTGETATFRWPSRPATGLGPGARICGLTCGMTWEM